MLTYCDHTLKITTLHNSMKIVEITQFLRNSALNVTLISKILTDLESRSQELENKLLFDYVRQTLSLRLF